MRAQVLTAAHRPLAAAELPAPRPGPQQILIAVRACAVCRTDLHVVDGELPNPKLPLVPGHEIAGDSGVLADPGVRLVVVQSGIVRGSQEKGGVEHRKEVGR